jgi:ureidoglycolate lyase
MGREAMKTGMLLEAEPLRAAAFAPFGYVIETAGHRSRSINQGTCERFDALAPVDIVPDGGRPMISIFRAMPRPLPHRVRILERHPLSTQAFYPLDGHPFLIVVAYDSGHAVPGQIRAFRAAGNQGVSYHRNTWHHALLAIGAVSQFLVVDRDGPGANCDQHELDTTVLVTTTA